MVRLWRWFKSPGHQPVGVGANAGATVPGPPSKAGALEQVAENWAEDGDREDQDYYHVPGAGNPHLKDPPTLDGDPLPTSGKKLRAKSGRT